MVKQASRGEEIGREGEGLYKMGAKDEMRVFRSAAIVGEQHALDCKDARS